MKKKELNEKIKRQNAVLCNKKISTSAEFQKEYRLQPQNRLLPA